MDRERERERVRVIFKHSFSVKVVCQPSLKSMAKLQLVEGPCVAP
jgi:hypothetical protein